MKRTSRPKILFINRVYPPVSGASGRMLRDLAHAFSRRGWKVTVLTTGKHSKTEQDGAVTVIRRAPLLNSKTKFSYLRVWTRLLVAGLFTPRHDIVVSLTDPPLLMTAVDMIARFKKSKHIHWSQDLYPDLLPVLGVKASSLETGVFRRLSVRALKRADKIIVIGRCMARRMTQKGIKPGNITFIPNWIDSELTAGAKKTKKKVFSKRKIKKAMSISGARSYEELIKDTENPKFRVLYAGNLGRSAAYNGMLQAASMLRDERPDIEFVFVGSGAHYEHLAQQKAKRHLDNIRLLPFQPFENLQDMLKSGDLHLVTMPEDAEGMLVPCKFYSSLAVHRPCVFLGPKESEVGQVIKDFSAGSVLAVDDGAALYKEIKKYRDDADLWFQAHEGAKAASKIFIPKESMDAWIMRAEQIAGVSIKAKPPRQTKSLKSDRSKPKKAA
jgi:glycosyltransferase involved in cell wall biosynthesis